MNAGTNNTNDKDGILRLGRREFTKSGLVMAGALACTSAIAWAFTGYDKRSGQNQPLNKRNQP